MQRFFLRCSPALWALACGFSAQTPTSVLLVVSPVGPVSSSAAVTPTASGSPSAATGRVTFYDGVTVLATKTLVSGAASFTTTLLPSGVRNLRAYYAGDTLDASSTSNIVIYTVNAVGGSVLVPSTA